jgi:PAS domain S-box-containing protein
MTKVRVQEERDGPTWLGSARFRARFWLALLGIFFCASSVSAVTSQQQAKGKNVLVLSGGSGHSPSIDLMESTLQSHVPWPVKFSAVADLEDPPFDKKPYRDTLAQALKSGFGGATPDLVMAVMDPSLRFAMEYRDKMFPNVPIVFMSVSSPQAEQQKWRWPEITGVASAVGVRETIALGLHLHPDTKTVAVITNASDTENEYLRAAQSELLRLRDKVKEIDLIGPPSGELLQKVNSLPPHTIALFQLWPHDSDHKAVYDVLAPIAARIPTYCIFTGLCLGHGGVGGAYTDPKNDAVLAGGLGARLLSGERTENVPIARNSSLQVTVDWRALQRWHIPESALPQGSIILYRQLTFWQRNRKYIVPIVALILAQSLLIAGLLWQRARKRKAEAVLRESEERFRRMADTTPSLVWMCDAQGSVTYLNDRRILFTGRDPNAGFGDTWTTYIHPDDRAMVLEANSRAVKSHQPYSTEYRLRRNDGVYRSMFDVAAPRVNGDGSFAGFIGSAIDVTDQKLAQEALQHVSGQLIEAQENERIRIARDLHDDICQRLALLSMELEQAKRDSAGRVSATKTLEEIRKHCSEIAGDVQSMSHQLHSSKLDYLGIVAAVRGFCKEFSKQYRVAVEFADRNVPQHLPKDISLCLFRVTQEALNNAAKYSGTEQFKVDLIGTADEILLRVRDRGTGFDVEQAKETGGLGLVSMRERVHLVQGRFEVESRRGAGTTISVSVPLVAEKQSSLQYDVARDIAGMVEIG